MHDVALSFLAYDMATVLLQIFYRKIDRRSTNANSIPRTQHADDGWRRRAGEINLSIPDRSRSTEMARDINLVISRWRTTLTAIICARSSAVARPKSISPPPPRRRQRTTENDNTALDDGRSYVPPSAALRLVHAESAPYTRFDNDESLIRRAGRVIISFCHFRSKCAGLK